MSESLTPFEGENLASYEALKTAIRLADGFSLIFAVTNTEAGAQEVMRRLWRDGVRYQKAWLRDPERPLVDQVTESVRTKQPVMVLGLEGLTTVGEQMGRSLRNLNWTRPQWTARLPQTIVFWVTADMEADLAREAPDLWRFRSLRVEFKLPYVPNNLRVAQLRGQLRTIDFTPQVRLQKLLELFDMDSKRAVAEEALNIALSNGVDLPAKWAGKSIVEWISITDTPVNKKILKGLSQLPRLIILDLLNASIRDTDTSLLVACRSIQLLGLSRNELGDSGIREIARLRNLRGLAIQSTFVTDDGLEALSGMRKLESLFLSDTQIGDRGLAKLSDLSALNLIDLRNTNVSDECVVELTRFKSLREILVEGTNVTRDAKLALIDIFAQSGHTVIVR